MKTTLKSFFYVSLLASLWLTDFDAERSLTPVFMADAHAVIGRPLTPVSAAGVARRTTRRAVYASNSNAQAQQQQAAEQQAAQQQTSTSRLPAGTVVTALPSGCQSTTVDGISLFSCGGVFYKPTFQSNNLVYVVQ